MVHVLDELTTGLSDTGELLLLAEEEDDADTVGEVENDIARFEKQLAALEFRRMFSGEMDANNAFLDIQSGAGGTEAQDWVEMLLRMYLYYCESMKWKVEELDRTMANVPRLHFGAEPLLFAVA